MESNNTSDPSSATSRFYDVHWVPCTIEVSVSLPIMWTNYSIYISKWLGGQNEIMHIKPFVEYLVLSSYFITNTFIIIS